ncbi:hypothetical protein Bmul_5237 [Burkholderia multivorans ATCC 17616]|nr:hypothetical protein Bmul_5237 [Burkholderia multivorans ATCC 17616]
MGTGAGHHAWTTRRTAHMGNGGTHGHPAPRPRDAARPRDETTIDAFAADASRRCADGGMPGHLAEIGRRAEPHGTRRCLHAATQTALKRMGRSEQTPHAGDKRTPSPARPRRDEQMPNPAPNFPVFSTN